MLYRRVVISASFHSSFLLANHEAFIARSLLLRPVRCVTIRPLPLSHVTRPTVELPKQPSEHHACDFIPADDPKPPPGDVSVTVQVFEALRFSRLTRLSHFVFLFLPYPAHSRCAYILNYNLQRRASSKLLLHKYLHRNGLYRCRAKCCQHQWRH